MENNYNMMVMLGFELEKDCKVFGIWYMDLRSKPLADPHANITAILTESDGSFDLRWRVRIYNDSKVFNSSDRRIGAHVKSSKPDVDRDAAVEKAKEIVKQWADLWNTETDLFETEWCDIDGLIEKLRASPPPWLNIKCLQSDEKDKSDEARKRFRV